MTARRLKVFISSVQREFEKVRSDLKAFLLGDVILRRFLSEVFLFEELPAADRRPDEAYLGEIKRCDIYIGIFGNEYGFEDEQGVSPTEREFEYAKQLGKTRLIYVWGNDDTNRAPKMRALIRKASAEVIRRRVENLSALRTEIYHSLVELLEQTGALRIPPFDTSVSEGAKISDLSTKRMEWFVSTAKRERGFPLVAPSNQALLTHLNLLNDGNLTNAAVLLFGKNPQSVHRSAEIKCVYSFGTKYQTPFASQQIYTGDLFEQADQARDFVLSKINRVVGSRTHSNVAEAEFELPPAAISESIINALAHRDYNSNGSVEVRLFGDRLEVWNPGTLPGTLTLNDLRIDHPSVPNNPLIAESLYLTRYIEKAGSGTQKMIELCNKYELPEPEFRIQAGSFVVTLWRDWLTDNILTELDLTERQKQAVIQVKATKKISNKEYQDAFDVSKPTATRDLEDMVEKGVLIRVGSTGKGTHYTLNPKGLTKGSKDSSSKSHKKGSQRAQRARSKKSISRKK